MSLRDTSSATCLITYLIDAGTLAPKFCQPPMRQTILTLRYPMPTGFPFRLLAKAPAANQNGPISVIKSSAAKSSTCAQSKAQRD